MYDVSLKCIFFLFLKRLCKSLSLWSQIWNIFSLQVKQIPGWMHKWKMVRFLENKSRIWLSSSIIILMGFRIYNYFHPISYLMVETLSWWTPITANMLKPPLDNVDQENQYLINICIKWFGFKLTMLLIIIHRSASWLVTMISVPILATHHSSLWVWADVSE